MEHDDGVFLHQTTQLFQIVHQQPLKRILVVNIKGTLDMARLELVIESCVDNNEGMRSRADQICQYIGTDCILFIIHSLAILQFRQNLRFIV